MWLTLLELILNIDSGFFPFNFVITDRSDHSHRDENFTFNKKNILQDQSNPKTHTRSRWFFCKNSWGKPISISKWLVRPWSGRPILSFGKCPMIAPTPILFQNFHFNLFQPVKMNQGNLKQMVLQLYQPLCEIRKHQRWKQQTSTMVRNSLS